MPDQTVFSTTDGHRLFSLQLGSGTTEDAAASGSSKLEIQTLRAHVRDGLMLDLRLETCVHGKLSNGKDFLSLIVFALQPVAQIGENIPSLSSMTISLGFNREIPQEHDIIEVLETGKDGSLTAEVSTPEILTIRRRFHTPSFVSTNKFSRSTIRYMQTREAFHGRLSHSTRGRALVCF